LNRISVLDPDKETDPTDKTQNLSMNQSFRPLKNRAKEGRIKGYREDSMQTISQANNNVATVIYLSPFASSDGKEYGS